MHPKHRPRSNHTERGAQDDNTYGIRQRPCAPFGSHSLDAVPSPGSPESARPRQKHKGYPRQGGSGRGPRSPLWESIPEETVWPPPAERRHRRPRVEQSTHTPLESSTELSSESESESEQPQGRRRHQREEERTPRPGSRSSEILSVWDRRGSRESAPEQETARGRGRHREEETHPASSFVRAVTPEGLRMQPGTPSEDGDESWAPTNISHLHYADRQPRPHRGSVRHEDPAHSHTGSSEDLLTALPPMPHHNHEATTPLEKARAKVRKNPSRYRAASSRPKRQQWLMWFIAGLAVRLPFLPVEPKVGRALTHTSVLTACHCDHRGHNCGSHGGKW